MKKFDNSEELVFTDEELPTVRPKSRLVRREKTPTNRRKTRSMTTEKEKEEMDRADYLREESSSSVSSSSTSASTPSLPVILPSPLPPLPRISSKSSAINLVSPNKPIIDLVSSSSSEISNSKSLGSESSQSQSESRSNLSFVEKDESSSSYNSRPESILVSSGEENSDERVDYQLALEHYGLFNALKIFNWLSMSIEEFNKFLSNPYIDKKLFHLKSLFSNGSRGAKKVPFDGIMKSYWADELEVIDILPKKDVCCICLYTRTTTRKIKTYDTNIGGVGPDCYDLKVVPLFDLVDLIKRAVDLIRFKKYRAGTLGFDREIYRPFNKIVDRISHIDIKMADRY